MDCGGFGSNAYGSSSPWEQVLSSLLGAAWLETVAGGTRPQSCDESGTGVCLSLCFPWGHFWTSVWLDP